MQRICGTYSLRGPKSIHFKRMHILKMLLKTIHFLIDILAKNFSQSSSIPLKYKKENQIKKKIANSPYLTGLHFSAPLTSLVHCK